MAEFCLECVNKLFSDEVLTEKDVIMSEDFCEGCGEWKPCVILIKEKKLFARIKQYLMRFTNPISIYFYKKKSLRARKD